MNRLMIVIFLISQWLAAAAFAECVLEGRTYRTGEKAEGVTCQPDGSWK